MPRCLRRLDRENDGSKDRMLVTYNDGKHFDNHCTYNDGSTDKRTGQYTYVLVTYGCVALCITSVDRYGRCLVNHSYVYLQLMYTHVVLLYTSYTQHEDMGFKSTITIYIYIYMCVCVCVCVHIRYWAIYIIFI